MTQNCFKSKAVIETSSPIHKSMLLRVLEGSLQYLIHHTGVTSTTRQLHKTSRLSLKQKAAKPLFKDIYSPSMNVHRAFHNVKWSKHSSYDMTKPKSNNRFGKKLQISLLSQRGMLLQKNLQAEFAPIDPTIASGTLENP